MPETGPLIEKWISRSENEQDPFVRFFMLYMCLDAWMTSVSNEDRDDRKLDWLLQTDNDLKESWHSTPLKEDSLHELYSIGKVKDLRPRHDGTERHLSNPDNFEEVILFIYQVRCNLFHGGKRPDDSNDIRLVNFSADLLYKWLKHTYNTAFL